MIFSSRRINKLQREVRLLREENNELKKLIDEAATQLEHAHEMMREYIEVMNKVVHEHRKENENNDEI